MTVIPTDDWLHALNEKFRSEGIDIRDRPWKAIDYYQQAFGINSIRLDSSEAEKIFSWFQKNTQHSARTHFQCASQLEYHFEVRICDKWVTLGAIAPKLHQLIKWTKKRAYDFS